MNGSAIIAPSSAVTIPYNGSMVPDPGSDGTHMGRPAMVSWRPILPAWVSCMAILPPWAWTRPAARRHDGMNRSSEMAVWRLLEQPTGWATPTDPSITTAIPPLARASR